MLQAAARAAHGWGPAGVASVAEPLQRLLAAWNVCRKRDKRLSESVAGGVPPLRVSCGDRGRGRAAVARLRPRRASELAGGRPSALAPSAARVAPPRRIRAANPRNTGPARHARARGADSAARGGTGGARPGPCGGRRRAGCAIRVPGHASARLGWPVPAEHARPCVRVRALACVRWRPRGSLRPECACCRAARRPMGAAMRRGRGPLR